MENKDITLKTVSKDSIPVKKLFLYLLNILSGKNMINFLMYSPITGCILGPGGGFFHSVCFLTYKAKKKV